MGDNPAVSRSADRLWDVAVVGAGPAGATAALNLAARGRRVLLLDRHRFPRDKVCGDGLIPDALTSLRSSGLYEAVRRRAYPAQVVSVYSPSRIRVDLPGEFLTVRRETLDALLVEGALERGAAFESAEVTALARRPDEVRLRLRGGSRPVRARFAVLATGADVSLLEAAGMVLRRPPSGVAVRCYVRSPVLIEELVVSLDRSVLPGYAWIFPLGDGEYNVGCGTFYRGRRNRRANLRDAFAAFVRQFPEARELMRRARHATPLRGAMLRCGLDGARVHDGGRIVAVGESVGTTFPFTGEGIGKAMESGALAADHLDRAIAEDRIEALHPLAARIEREMRPRYLGYRVAETWVSQSWLADRLAARVARTESLRRAAAGILAETVDPQAVFRWRNLLPRWLR